MTNTKKITDIDILWNDVYYFSCRFSIDDTYVFSIKQIDNYIDALDMYISHMAYNLNAFAVYDKSQRHRNLDTEILHLLDIVSLIHQLPKNADLKYVLNQDMLNTYFLLYDVKDFYLPQDDRAIINEIYIKTNSDISKSYISIKSDENTNVVKTVISPIFALHRTKEETICTSVSFKEKEY